ncbi:MAG: polymer-forming cytoskeletal protein [Alphaproteobacteria bacterium]
MTESSQVAANAGADAGLGEDGKSIVSKNFSIVGDLTCEDFLQIDGSVEGNIACRQLNVSESGRIKGDIRADTVEMHGTLTGAIDARVLTLSKSSNVVGDIVVQESLGIEPGASFDGSCKKLGSSESAGEDDAAGAATGELAALEVAVSPAPAPAPKEAAGEGPQSPAPMADAGAPGETASDAPAPEQTAPEPPAPKQPDMEGAAKADGGRIPGESMQSALDKVAAELKATMSMTKTPAAPASPPQATQKAAATTAAATPTTAATATATAAAAPAG